MPRSGNDAGDKHDFSLLPYNLRRLVEHVGFPEIRDIDEDEAKIYELVRHGRCMTCEQRLGEHANFIITRIGIVGGYCSGVCHSDMAVLGFLQEQHQDITQKVDFRKGESLQVEEIPDTIGDDPAFEEDEGEGSTSNGEA